jgi:glucosamine--fructose-6-phosphate aminotransferase (isomerizing)
MSVTASGHEAHAAGLAMDTEIAAQPQVFERILRDGVPLIDEIAAVITARRPRFVLLTARGTSDNAAVYGKYLVEVLLGLPAGLTSPSTTTAYGARPDLRDVLVVSVSQSGGSPDIVESTAIARECGATTLAVTNNADSKLAQAAELHLDVLAGPEKALPATKTYTAQLLTLYLLVQKLAGRPTEAAEALPGLAVELLEQTTDMTAVAARYRFADQLVVTGRGYSYATAREAALKIMETSYLSAHAFSGADLLHGPLAMVDDESPVIAVAPDGVGGVALEPVIERLRERRCDLFVVGAPRYVAQATLGFELPGGVDEDLSPMLEILPLQRLAYEIAVTRGLDPDSPRALAKITRTW